MWRYCKICTWRLWPTFSRSNIPQVNSSRTMRLGTKIIFCHMPFIFFSVSEWRRCKNITPLLWSTFQGQIFQVLLSLSETVRDWCRNVTYATSIDFNTSYRTAPLRKLHSVTWIYILRSILSPIVTKLFAQICHSLVRHPPSSWSCFVINTPVRVRN